MSERIYIGTAWPYADGPLHLGHVAGAYLAPDIFARYHRLIGNEVLMVSGSDQHGTPITIKAEKDGTTPAVIADTYHRDFLDCWDRLGISYDLFTNTGTENHTAVTQDIFLKLLDKGYIYRDTVSQAYCPQCKRFLPDRYTEGTCPDCGYEGTRGDQCDGCGHPLNPADLLNPKCGFCGTTPDFKETEHFFLKLTAFRDELLNWVKQQDHWKPNVRNFTEQYLEDGLKDRAITRDIEWGIKIPLPGFENKRIYVWFEAVIGYLSASKEWATLNGDSDKWKPFWQDKSTKNYYFIGKDNIPFHTIIWPAMLMGYGDLNLPYDVPANEFLTIEGKKLSTSRNWAVWLPDYLDKFDPDPLRYLLSINMPETSDTDFSWREYVRRNNDELVATYGNLAHRVLTFVNRNFDGCVPQPGEFDEASRQLLEKADETLKAVGEQLSLCHFREGIKTAMKLAHEANRYLDDTSPWKVIKENRQAAATSLYTVICILSCLKTVLYPFLPFSSQKLNEYLGFTAEIKEYGWAFTRPEPGQKLVPPKPLFTKLDESVVEEESARLGS